MSWLARQWRLLALLAVLLGYVGWGCLAFGMWPGSPEVGAVLGLSTWAAALLLGLMAGAGLVRKRADGRRTETALQLLTGSVDLMGRERVTGRMVLDRGCRRAGRIAYTGYGLWVVGLAGTVCGLFCLFALVPLGFPVLFLGILYANLRGIRCPWCRANLTRLWAGGLSFDPRVQRCPYCENHLDDEVSEPAPPAEPIGGTEPPPPAPVPTAALATGRAVLDRRTRRVMGVVYLGAGLALIGMVGGAAGAHVMFGLALIGIPMAFLAGIFAHSGQLRCPWCRTNLSVLMENDGSFNRGVRLCPYCEHRLDEALPERAEPGPDAGG